MATTKNYGNHPCRHAQGGAECPGLGFVRAMRHILHIGASDAWCAVACQYSACCKRHEPFNPDEELNYGTAKR